MFYKSKKPISKYNQFFHLYDNLAPYLNITLTREKYFSNLNLIFDKYKNFLFDKIYKHKTYKSLLYTHLFNYLFVYNNFYLYNFINLFFKTSSKNLKNFFFFNLIWSFKKKNLFVTLANSFKRSVLSISTGLFIKFYEKKKSLKKTKAIKFLAIKFLRKILLILKINNLIFKILKKPIFFLELLTVLNQPISHKFNNPCENKFVDETTSLRPNAWRFIFFIFSKNTSFSKLKLKKRGRIKRKILRKIILTNKLID